VITELPKSIRPTRYTLRIDVDLDNWRFAAREHRRYPDHAAASVTLHAVDLQIQDARSWQTARPW
jgi:hypothetical protein